MPDVVRRYPSAVSRRLLDGPLLGWAPWIALSVLVGPGRFIASVLVALAMAVGFISLDRLQGHNVKVLALVDVTLFAGFLVLGVTASTGTHTWLETWFGEISNLSFALVAAGSILVRRPITLQYAHAFADCDDSRLHRSNYVLTAVWCGAFVVAGLAALLGDAVLHNNSNLWTAWVVQIAAELAAAEFTLWYPQRHATGGSSSPHEALLLPLAVYLLPVGVLSIWLDAAPTLLGAVFIAAGVVATLRLGQKARGRRVFLMS